MLSSQQSWALAAASLFTRKHFWEMKQVHSPRHSPVVALGAWWCDLGLEGRQHRRSGEKGTVYLRGRGDRKEALPGARLESAPFLGHGFPFQGGLSYAPAWRVPSPGLRLTPAWPAGKSWAQGSAGHLGMNSAPVPSPALFSSSEHQANVSHWHASFTHWFGKY